MSELPESAAPAPGRVRALLGRYWWAAGLALVVAVVALAVNYASSDPDGLQKVAQDKSFADSAQSASHGWLPGYAVPGIGGDASRILAGLVGVAIVFVAIMLIGRVMARRNQ